MYNKIDFIFFDRGRHVFLQDRHSSNGTFVNKTRILADEDFEIFDGDVIQFGQVLNP